MKKDMRPAVAIKRGLCVILGLALACLGTAAPAEGTPEIDMVGTWYLAKYEPVYDYGNVAFSGSNLSSYMIFREDGTVCKKQEGYPDIEYRWRVKDGALYTAYWHEKESEPLGEDEGVFYGTIEGDSIIWKSMIRDELYGIWTYRKNAEIVHLPKAVEASFVSDFDGN